jgi:maltose alpha-D-glucosyltransferase/alpha-amylase
MLKLYRKLGVGVSPEVELGRHLSARYAHVPALVGWLEYVAQDGTTPLTLGVVHRFVPCQGDAWTHALAELQRYGARAFAEQRPPPAARRGCLVGPLDAAPPPRAQAMIGGYLEAAHLLGQRVAELHVVLGAATADPALRPARYARRDQQAAHASACALAARVLRTLRHALAALPEEHRAAARRVLESERRIARVFEGFLRGPITAQRIRCHGDLHLGQVLFLGQDFAIIDFEGEPAARPAARRRKHCALRDVAGMLRSFHYAAATAFNEVRDRGAIGQTSAQAAEDWLRVWQAWSCQSFLRGYLAAAQGSPILPASRDELVRLLGAFMLEKAIYELGYELNTRPAFVGVPLAGIAQILEELGI